jgi:hypothetical protein
MTHLVQRQHSPATARVGQSEIDDAQGRCIFTQVFILFLEREMFFIQKFLQYGILVSHWFYKIEDFSGKPGLLFSSPNIAELSIDRGISGCARLT